MLFLILDLQLVAPVTRAGPPSPVYYLQQPHYLRLRLVRVRTAVMIPRSRASGRQILERAVSQTTSSTRYALAGHRLLSPSYRVQTPYLRPTTQRAPQSAVAFTTSARLGKERDRDNKGKSFFDSTTEPPTEPLSEEEAKANLENSKREAEEKAAAEAKTSGNENQASAKNEGGSQAPDNKAGGAAGSAAGGSGSSGDGSSGDGGKRGRKSAERALAKPVVPEVYPQVLAIPITRRPLFPGFYKAITIKDPDVATAITESIKRGQPYVGAFLFKDENQDEDVIRNVDDVYDVGVFAQITSAFPIHGQEGALTAILYPHRRIKLSSLIPPGGQDTTKKAETKTEAPAPEPIPQKSAEDDVPQDKKGDVVASFEESAVDKKPDQVAEKYEPTSFLKRYPVSLVNVENMSDEPYDPKSQVIRAVTNEIVNVFKEVATMNNLFRDQISWSR